ncbi:MAG: cytidine deaminase [Bacteroidota bacterium]|nr:cytidine deaminase [Bacteroidota bacterium]
MSITRNISFSYQEFNSIDELDIGDRELINAARESARKAYAPYSKFIVGAALRLASGKVITGSNVENAAFPSGICAERTALSCSVSNFPDDAPVAMAIAAYTEDNQPAEYISPCGNCRQVIAEEELRTGSKIKIILTGRNNIQIINSISDLLPLQFNRNSFKAGLHG